MESRRIAYAILFILVNLFQASAQNGPGGVGSSTTNVLWLRADQQVYNNGGTTPAANNDNVQQWNDQSGNNDHATQATLGNRPNYVTNVINGFPAIRYTAGNADMLLATSVATANFASVWAVASYASLPSSNPGILIGSPAGTGNNAPAGDKCIGMWVASGSGNIWGRGVQSNSTIRDLSQTIALSSNTFYIVNNIYGGASINQYLNHGAAGSNGSHNGTLRSWTDITIGRQGTESWQGDIAEVIFYNVEVNSAQRIIIDNYLAAKYTRTLTANDVYDEDNSVNGNFDYEVAGIGRVDASNLHADAKGSGMVRIYSPSGLGNDEFLMWGHNNLSALATNNVDIPGSMQDRISRVWRASEVSSSGAVVDVGNVTVQWDLSAHGAVTTSDLRMLVDTDNDGVFTDETPISGAASLGGGLYEFSGVSTIANNLRFTIGTVNKVRTPLPIELLEFVIDENAQGTLDIIWETATEKQCSHFEVESSIDGLKWKVIGRIEGGNNSMLRRKYIFTDEHPYQGVSYYRLVQYDLDGKSKTFTSRYVEHYFHSPILEVYPNPTSDCFFIRGGDSMEIELYDSFGRKIAIDVERWNDREIKIQTSSLSEGIYLLKYKNSNFRVVINHT